MNARRMLDRLELEHMAHAGRENGNLVVTFDQFVDCGIRREAIARTMAELDRLGWIEVHRGLYRGCARSDPNRFRLTARRTRASQSIGEPYFVEGTHDWRRYRSKKIGSNGAGTGTATVPEPAR